LRSCCSLVLFFLKLKFIHDIVFLLNLKNMKSESRLTNSGETRDLQNLFPLFKDLFAFAQKNLPEGNFDKYTGADETGEPGSVELPPKFQPLIKNFPGVFFIVGYENRQSSYNREGTRNIWIRLSTVKRKTATDDKVREVDFSLVDPSKGQAIEISVTDSVNNQCFEKVNDSEDTEFGQPHGSFKIISRLESDGEIKAVGFKFNRLDEGLFNFGDALKVVRWVRDLEVEKISTENAQRLNYQELYIIGRSKNIGKEERAFVKTQIDMVSGKPKNILVQIGFGDFKTGNVIYEDEKTGISVFAGHRHDQKQIDVLKQDPTYALLFQTKVDPNEFVESLLKRVEMLRDDWDKTQTVYQSSPGIEQARPAITQIVG